MNYCMTGIGANIVKTSPSVMCNVIAFCSCETIVSNKIYCNYPSEHLPVIRV